MRVKKNVLDINEVCTHYPEMIAKPIITKLSKDNQRVIKDIDYDSQASAFSNESMINLGLKSDSDNPDVSESLIMIKNAVLSEDESHIIV